MVDTVKISALTDTFNTGTDNVAISMNVSAPSPGAFAKLIQLSTDGVPKFNVSLAGVVTATVFNGIFLGDGSALTGIDLSPPNTYATSVGTSGNTYATSVGIGANTYVLSAYTQANIALTTAQSAYDSSNTKFSSAGGTVSGSITVPTLNVSNLNITSQRSVDYVTIGAGGGGGGKDAGNLGSSGGSGGIVYGTLTINLGNQLTILVGGGGQAGTSNVTGTGGGTAGTNGGGVGGKAGGTGSSGGGGGGGGYSAINLNITNLAVAGGGGGGGAASEGLQDTFGGYGGGTVPSAAYSGPLANTTGSAGADFPGDGGGGGGGGGGRWGGIGQGANTAVNRGAGPGGNYQLYSGSTEYGSVAGTNGAGNSAANTAIPAVYYDWWTSFLSTTTGIGGGSQGAGRVNGGDGIVIIRYTGSQIATGGTVSASGGYTYHVFTSNNSTYTANT